MERKLVIVLMIIFAGLMLGATGKALYYFEDAPHVSGDQGVIALGVRTDTHASLAGTTGDFTANSYNAGGSLYTVPASGLPSAGSDDTGAAGYVTIVTAPARQTHYLHISVANNGATISLDGGSTEHFNIPANTSWLLEGLVLPASAVIQGKDISGNYTNLYISVW